MPWTDPPTIAVNFEMKKGSERVLASILRLSIAASERSTTLWPRQNFSPNIHCRTPRIFQSPRGFSWSINVDRGLTLPCRDGKSGVVASAVARRLVCGSAVIRVAADGGLCACPVDDSPAWYLNAVFAPISTVGGTRYVFAAVRADDSLGGNIDVGEETLTRRRYCRISHPEV